MAGRNYSLTFLTILLFLCVNQIENSKLNVPRVLLPLFKGLSINFTLEVTEGGCYKWSASRLDIVQLFPQNYDEDRGCSASVVVSTISKEASRNTAIILAEEVQSEQVLRCDVIVDVIFALNIVTTTRELYIEEAPEAFEVRAYDDQGNEFTTLQGVPFSWSIAAGASKGDTILRFITFKESPYETPESVLDFDDRGIQGHIVLLEGVRTGSAKVSVKLPHGEYKHIGDVEVLLTVIANLLIDPSDMYILIGATIHFKIFQMQNNKLDEISLPNPQYYLSSEDMTIVSSNEKTGDVTAVSIGKTRIVVNDRNVDASDVGIKLPSATVNVVAPAYMTINILPYRNWAILLGDHHDIVVEVFASNDHRIYLGESVDVSIQIDTKYFSIKEKTTNGTWLTGFGTTPGFSPVHAALESVNKIRVDPRVSVRADLNVYPRILLNPGEIIMPWDPIVRPKYEVKLRATGGDGNFLWSTTNAAVAVVTQAGVVKTQTHGTVEISAAMARNHHNRKICKVQILPAIRLEIVEFVLEAEVDQPVYLQVALYADRGGGAEVPFTKCSEIPFKVKISDGNFYYNDTAAAVPVGTACTTIAIVGQTVGSAKVTVYYTFGDKTVEDSVTVSSFRRLTVLNPKKAETVLAVGSSRNVILTGGPRPAVGRPNEHSRALVISDEAKVSATDITDSLKIPGEPDTYIVTVLCRQLGEAVVELAVTNSPLLPACKHFASAASIKVICGKPRLIQLRPQVDVTTGTHCPLDLNAASKVAVHNNEHVELSVIVKDELGRRFENISTFIIEWTLTPGDLATVLNPTNAFAMNKTESTVFVPHKHYQILQPKGNNGLLEITASVTGYNKDMLSATGVTVESPPFIDARDRLGESPQVLTMMNVYLVGDTHIVPDIISIYNHPDNKQFLDVRQGSGYYEIALSSKDIATVKYSEVNREIEITPKANGELRISLTDLCLPSRPTPIIVHVVSVKSIKVDMTDRVEIGRCIKAIVKLYDDADMLLPVPDMEMLDLRSIIEVNVISVKLSTQEIDKPWSVGEVHYVVTGIDLGDTKLTFATGRGPREARSAPVHIQVFSPLRVMPRNTTILVSSVLQLSSRGGPQPDSNVEFKADSGNIVSVEPNGLIEGLAFGTTRVVGTAIGVNPSSGQRVIYSEDSVDISVVGLQGIKIGAPLARFKVGATVPAWALGIPDQITPLVLGTTTKEVLFNWQLSSEDVVIMFGVFDDAGITYEPKDQVSVRLYGNKAGRVTLTLKVTIPQVMAECKKGCTSEFVAALELEVFEGLALLPPPMYLNQEILLAPDTTLQLSTNRDTICHMAYAVQADSTPGVIHIKPDKKSVPVPVVTVSNSGLVRSSQTFGRAVIVVTALEDFGLKQTISITVQVKPVHYILLTVMSKMQVNPEEEVHVLPRGMALALKITYHDNTGDTFTAASNEVRVRTSRMDLSTVRRGPDNTSLIANLIKPGDTVLKVWDEGFSMRTVDYIKLHVGEVIEPALTQITNGDIVCYTIPLVTPDGAPGQWGASNNAVQGGELDGVMMAVKPRDRPTTITHSLGPGCGTSTDVQVMAVTHISFIPGASQSLSNAFAQSIQEIPLVLCSSLDPTKKTNLITAPNRKCMPDPSHQITEFPFTCKIAFTNPKVYIDISEIFTVEPSFSFKTGQYSCRVITNNAPNVNTSMLSNNITLIAKSGHIEEKIDLCFVPGVFIDTTELYLADNKHKGYVIIHGIPDVLSKLTVEPVDPEILEISIPTNPTPNSRKFDVTLLDVHWKSHGADDSMGIIVKSHLTKQNIKMPVKTSLTHVPIMPGGSPECLPSPKWGSPLMEMLWDFRQVFAILASVIGMFLITLYAYAQYIQPVITVNVAATRSLLMERPDRRNSPSAGTAAGFMSMGRSNTSRNDGSVTKGPFSSQKSSPYACMDNRPVYGDPTSSQYRNRRF